MIKGLFWMAVGAAGALEADKWLQRRKAQLRPSVLTGRLLDTANTRLEQSRARAAAVPGRGGGDPL
jgi:hypothetical protein